MEFNNLVEGILQSLNETKEAPDGYYYTKKGNLRKGNPESDGRGGPKFASDPTDRKNYGPRENEEGKKGLTGLALLAQQEYKQGEKIGRDGRGLGPDSIEKKDKTSEDPEEDAEYRGRKVSLNKPTRGDVKKFKVYVKDPKSGNVKKVNFGHGGTSAKRKGEKTMKIRKSNPKARKSFRARHNCDNPGPKTKARYWSCRKW